MNNEFKEKLQLYKEGKLIQNEVAEIECEIDKFNALMDYVNDEDKAFLEGLKQQLPAGNGEENGPFGAKSVGEISVNAVAPAVINAINNALGVNITTMPANQERVVSSLKELKRKS